MQDLLKTLLVLSTVLDEDKFSFSRLEDARYMQEPEIVTNLPKMKQLLEETQLSNLYTNSSIQRKSKLLSEVAEEKPSSEGDSKH